jgi:hypothetical protein
VPADNLAQRRQVVDLAHRVAMGRCIMRAPACAPTAGRPG